MAGKGPDSWESGAFLQIVSGIISGYQKRNQSPGQQEAEMHCNMSVVSGEEDLED